jgi:hypothetical protein
LFTLNKTKKEVIMKDRMQECSPSSGAVYGLGLIGAAIYFISQATGFWMGVLGFLKAIVWPVFLVLEAFKSLGV